MSLLRRISRSAMGAGARWWAPARTLQSGWFHQRAVAPFANGWQQSRSFHGTTPTYFPLEEFFHRQQPGKVGRSWRVNELRLKSFEDLHKLWFVLLKERNMLYTYKLQCQRLGEQMKGENRISSVKASMARIKRVVHERSLAFKCARDPDFGKARQERYGMRANARRKANPANRFSKPLRQAVRRTHPMRKKIKFRFTKPTIVEDRIAARVQARKQKQHERNQRRLARKQAQE